MLDDSSVSRVFADAGLIAPDTLAQLGQRAASMRRPLYLVAMEMGAVDEPQAVALLAQQLGVQSVSLAGFQADDDLRTLLPANFVRQRQAMPVKKSVGAQARVFLAMIDPLDRETIDAAALAVQCEVVPVLVGPNDMRAAIDRAYGAPATTPTSSDNPFSTMQAPAAAPAGKSAPFGDIFPDGVKGANGRALDETPRSGLLVVPGGGSGVRSRLPGGKSGLMGIGSSTASSANFDALQALPTEMLSRAVVRVLVDKGLITVDEIMAAVRTT